MTEQYEALLALCQARHSIRDFSAEPVSPAMVEQIRAVAQTSPYASGRKNWQIMVVDQRPVIVAMAAATKQRSQVMGDNLREDFVDGFTEYARHFVRFENAPLLLIPIFRVAPTLSYMQSSPAPDTVRWERENYVKSIACVTMHILLAATALGLGACFMTGPLLAEEALRRLVGVRPGYEIGAIVPVGHPALTSTDI